MREHIGVSKVIISLVSATGMSSDRECSIEGETALVVGADRMGPLAARAVTEWADHVIVATRTVPHDEHVADSIEAETTTVGLDGLEPAVAEASVVVSATGSNTRVSDVDSFESLTNKTQSTRRRAARDGERLVDSEFDHLLTQYKRKWAERVISAMHETAQRVKTTEVDTAMAKGEAVESMADTIVSQLLAAPTESLRDAAEKGDWSTIQTAVELFDLDCCSEPLEFVQPMSTEELPEEIHDQLQPAILEQLVGD